MNFMLDWPELVALIFLIIGLVFALTANNAIVLYVVCFIMGLIFGRMWYRFKLNSAIPLFILIMGLFLGLALGGIWANLRIITLVLLAGWIAGYWLHAKKIVRSF